MFLTILWNMALLISGSMLSALAVNGILIPQNFISGGVTGLSLLIHYLFPACPVATLYFFINIPLFILGWLYVSRRFFFYSIAGMLFFTAAVSLIHIPIPVHDPLLSALLAGIISGAGSGLMLKSYGSAGGTDILSVILLKRFSIKIGTTVLAFNALLLSAAAIVFTLESALYALIFMFVSSKIIDIVVTGLSQRKAVLIISSQWREISKEIMENIHRGTTIFQGIGGYTGKQENIIYTVVTFREMARLKEIVRRIDPNAFVVITDTLEIIGRRIGNQPAW